MERTQAWKDEIAMALLLWKDFKADGRFDPTVVMTVLRLADDLGVREEYDELIVTIPPLKIVERYPRVKEG